MKSFIKMLTLGGVCLAGILSACTNDMDFLTEKPKDIFTVDNAYNNSSQVLATVLTAYYDYEAFYHSEFFGAGPMGYRTAGTDIGDGNYQVDHISNITASWSSTSGFVKSMWERYYKIIASCNLALSQVEKVTWSSEAERSRIVAECHFLRGLSYMKLAEYFGGVPIVLEYSEYPRFDYTRATREATYDQAITDLKVAYAGLPVNVSADYGRAGKGAAALYLSEAYLALGIEKDSTDDYTTAAEYAEEVITMHPIMTGRFGVRLPGATGSNNGIDNSYPEGNVFTDLFVSQNVTSSANTEAIWVMATAPDYVSYAANGGYRNHTIAHSPVVQDINWAAQYVEKGAGDGPWKIVSSKYGGKANPPMHGGYTWGTSPLTWFVSYDLWNNENNNGSFGQDLRYLEGVSVRTVFLCTDPDHSLYEQYLGWDHIDKVDGNTASKFFPIFYKETPIDAWDYDLNDPGAYMGGFLGSNYRAKYGARSAEAYLLAAEAYLRAGDAGKALDALNAVRTRANANPMGNITIDIILDERARELLYEEDRWGTFLRMKPEEWQHRITKYGMYSARGGDKVYPEVRRWAEYTGDINFELWPIPQTYIDINTGAELAQNDGWN